MDEINFNNYQDLNSILAQHSSSFNASQVHGFICGVICTRSKKAQALLKNLIFSNKKSKKLPPELIELYHTSHHLLNDFSFEFNLVLPDDSSELSQRAEALGLWCQGFLSGLESTPLKEEPDESVEEALNDMTEIAQIDFEDILENEDDETAYYELVEHVRLCALMIFQGLNVS